MQTRTTSLISLALSLLVAACHGDPGGGPHLESRAQPLRADDHADAARLEAVLHRYGQGGLFMGAALVSRRGAVLLDRAYGMANAEWEVPNTTDTRFRIGSITKQFTASAILLLEEEGKLQVQDLLSQHVPDVPASWAGITLHHLLSHTSGIPDLVRQPEYPSIRALPTTLEKTYQLLRNKPLDFTPGERFQYSNSGYLMLALVIERLSGQSYDQLVRGRILHPLGMPDTGDAAHRPLAARRASGYVPLTSSTDPAPIAFRNCDFIDISIATGAGSMHSTTGDLLRFYRALFGGTLLSPASLQKMTTVQAGNYGYGLFIGTDQGLRRMGHSGSIHGFLTAVNYYPETEVVVVVLANLTASGWLGKLIPALMDIANGKEPPNGGMP